MSLKDRFSNNPQNPKSKEILKNINRAEIKPKYREINEEIAQFNSFGILDTILADDEINCVFVNGAKDIYVEKKDKITKTGANYKSDRELEDIVKKYLKNNGLNYEEKKYFSLNYKKGINFSITLPPLSSKTTIIIKRYCDKFATLKTMEDNLLISKEGSLFLETLSFLDINVLIIGDKKTLKTTTLSAIINSKINTNSIIIDYLNEIEVQNKPFAYFDFSKLNNLNEEKNILNSLIYLNPDKIFINSAHDEILPEIFKIASKNKGIMLTLEASNYNEALKKYKEVEDCFDIVILVKKEKDETGKIASISQIEKNLIQNIFYLNEFNRMASCGVVPKIYDEIRLKSLSYNQNIFDKNYKHTYSKDINISMLETPKKSINLDVLKKFKKDLALDNKNIKEEEIEQEQDGTL